MIFDRYKKSFPAKLSLYVISVITILSFVLVGVFYHYSTETLSQEAEDKIESMAAQANLRVSALLSKVEKIPENLGWMIVEYVKEPDSLFSITRRIVKDNPEIFGCVIAFEPYYFPEKGHYFAPYSYMVGDSVKTIQVGGKDYNYFEKGWYNGAREHRYWSKPYRDAGDPDVITTSYAVPVHGEKNELIGILSVDLTNRWLRDLVDSIKPYKGSYTVVIDKQGRYILRREGEVMIGQNMFETAKEARDTNVTILVNEMAAGKSGSIIVDDGGVLSYVYYTPVVETDWYMAVICPYDQVFGKLSKFNMYLLVGFVLLLLFVYFICFVAVRRITKPLTIFAASARDVAQGNFNTPLPRIRSKDELGELCSSFETMRFTLANNFSEMWRQMEERKQLNAAFAHDLRTPLTVLKGYNEILQSNHDPITKSTAATMRKHIFRLERYVDSMSHLRRLEDAQPISDKSNISGYVTAIADSARILCEQSGKTLSIQNNISDIPIGIDYTFVSQVNNNLISNAIRYATSKVNITYTSNNDGFYLSVSDNGCGFSKNILSKATNPYFTEEENHSEHFGLGLYICKILCEHHGGYLKIENCSIGAKVTAFFKSLD